MKRWNGGLGAMSTYGASAKRVVLDDNQKKYKDAFQGLLLFAAAMAVSASGAMIA